MLVDKNNKEYNPKNLPTNRKAKEAVLATLREVQVYPKRGGKFHVLSERAALKG